MRLNPWILAIALLFSAWLWTSAAEPQQGGKPETQVAITSPSNGAVLTSPSVDVVVSFSGSGGAKVDSIELRVNGTGVATHDIPRKTESGTETFSGVNLSAYANSGNPVSLVARAYHGPNPKRFVDSAAVLVTVTVQTDAIPPVILALAPANGSATNNPRPTLSAQVTDSGGSGANPSSIVMKLDGATVMATLVVVNPNQVTASFTPPADLAQGPHSVTVDAKDGAGNAAVQASSTFIIDRTSPVAAISSPANGLVTGNVMLGLQASVTDAGGSGVSLAAIVVKLDGNILIASTSLIDPNTASISFTPQAALAPGQHTYTVDASDRAGNSAATASSTFVVDASPPSLTLSPADGSRVLGPRPTLSASYSDSPAGVDMSTFRATLDGVDVTAGFVKGASSASYTPTAVMADGPHILRVDLADTVGNLAQSSTLFRSESALATIGTQGGTVEVTDPTRAGAGAKLVFPSGALAQEVLVFIEEVQSPPPFPLGYAPAGPALDFGPSMVFAQPVTIAVPYDPQFVAALGTSPFALRLLTFDLTTGMWILVPFVSIDSQNHLVVAEVTRIEGAVYQVGAPIVSGTKTLIDLSSGAVVADGISFTTFTVIPLLDTGTAVGPGATLAVTVGGVPNPSVQVQDLGNGVYQIFITSSATGTATVDISVNTTPLPQQTFAFTPAPASFSIDGFTSPVVAGVPSDLRVTARDQNGAILTSFVGSVEINLTGTRDWASLLVYPESFVATFTSADAGVLTLPGALLLTQAGTQQISVLSLTQPGVTGTASVSVTAGPPAVLVKVAGDMQSGAAGSVLPQRLAVRVTDAFGNPVQGVQVRFQASPGGAGFKP